MSGVHVAQHGVAASGLAHLGAEVEVSDLPRFWIATYKEP